MVLFSLSKGNLGTSHYCILACSLRFTEGILPTENTNVSGTVHIHHITFLLYFHFIHVKKLQKQNCTFEAVSRRI